jgi:hypothetical protein
VVVIDAAVRRAGNTLGEGNAFRRRQMRQLGVSWGIEGNHVADGGNAGHVRPELGVHVHVATIEPETGLLGAEA